MKHKKLQRPCSKCDKMFTPAGKFCKICPKCNTRTHGTGAWMQEFYKLQEKLKNETK